MRLAEKRARRKRQHKSVLPVTQLELQLFKFAVNDHILHICVHAAYLQM